MTQSNPANSDLDSLYDHIVLAHRGYLTKIQAAFDKQCEEIGQRAKDELAKIPEENREEREKILTQEQAELDKTLAELKKVVNKSNAETRKKLEEIENQQDAAALNLKQALADL